MACKAALLKIGRKPHAQARPSLPARQPCGSRRPPSLSEAHSATRTHVGVVWPEPAGCAHIKGRLLAAPCEFTGGSALPATGAGQTRAGSHKSKHLQHQRGQHQEVTCTESGTLFSLEMGSSEFRVLTAISECILHNT